MEENIKIELAGRVAENDSYSRYYGDNYEQSGSPKGYDLEKIFADPQGNIDKIFYLGKYYYAKSGIIMRVINIIRDFGVDGIDFQYKKKNEKAKEVIENFNTRIGLRQVMRDMIFELAQSGNVAGYNRDGKRIDIYPITNVEVSPLIVNNKPVLLYKNELSMSDLADSLPKSMLRKLELTYPKELAKGLRKGDSKIVLDVTNTFFHKVNSSRYEPYGVPFILTAFDELAHKTVLKEAERATATGIIEKILLIQVGEKEHKPKQAEIDYYSSLISGKKGSVKITVPHFVNLKWVEPETSIFGKDKFEQVDQDILNALGVSLTLIRGEGGGNYSEGFIAVTGLIKTIESLREGLIPIVREWHIQELERHNISAEFAPETVLNPIEIDKSAKVDLIKYLFQTAGLPYEVLYKEAGYDFDVVKLTRENENKNKVEDIFKLRAQPFQGGIDPNNKGGAPAKNLTDRKSDKNQSNNDQPRPSTSK
ncbi:hypothetical protein [Paenibacillus chitinolyticus]|uniref:hypothetical protein n=1 Tax=Paenibacillus chitinolyticus TaxID=79263 RepID=UPI003D045160